VAAVLHITWQPPAAAIQTEGKNHGSEEKGNEEARKGQETRSDQATNHGHETYRRIQPETVLEFAGQLLGTAPARDERISTGRSEGKIAWRSGSRRLPWPSALQSRRRSKLRLKKAAASRRTPRARYRQRSAETCSGGCHRSDAAARFLPVVHAYLL
jgi:hypothetical protein